METRLFKADGERVSLLGFGSMRFPLHSDRADDIDRELTFELIDYAMQHGVNYYDTGYGYHGGKSEVVLGEALSKYPRDSYFLTDKLPPWLLKERADVGRVFREQLERCKVDYFDFYLLHAMNEDRISTIEEVGAYEQLLELQREGKIRRLGFSYHGRPEGIEEILRRWPFEFAQIQLNYLDWDLQEAGRQYDILTQKGLPVIVMEPVRGGALVSLCEQSVSILKAANPNVSTASWAIRYAASLPGVLTVLSGMSTLDQVADNVKTMQSFTPLSPDERATIDQALEAYRNASVIPCTACGYCMDCDFGVDIPHVIGAYNSYCAGFKSDPVRFSLNYEVIGREHSADICTACGQCVPRCPQGIDIPAQMKLIDEEITAIRAKRG